MALSFSNVPSNEQTLFDADRPCIIANHLLQDRTGGQWRDAGGSYGAGNDVTDSSRPVSLAADRGAQIGTRPSSGVNGETSVYLQFALNDGTDVEHQMDSAVLIHRLGSVLNAIGAGTITAKLDLYDNASFTGGTTWVTWTVSSNTNRRLVEYKNSRYTGITHAQLTITATGGATFGSAADERPEILELWLGRRLQLAFAPGRPFDHKAEDADDRSSTYDTGAVIGAAVWRRRAVLSGVLSLATNSADFDGVDTYREAWTQAAARPYIFVPRPSSEDDRALLVRSTRVRMEAAEVGAVLRQARLEAVEQPPFYGLGF